KSYFFPPELVVSRAEKTTTGWEFSDVEDDPPPRALIGVRACELAALRRQDRVFLAGACIDSAYQRRRERNVLIAVNCTRCAGTCFCASMGGGPGCASGYDLALTELDDGFVMQAGSKLGETLLEEAETRRASVGEVERASAAVDAAARDQIRRIARDDVGERLGRRLEDPRWEEIGDRCLACGNCAAVCPTCFCSSLEEASDLMGERVERVRRWDACFGSQFGYMNGGGVRVSAASRYRQWMMHKLAWWDEQFGACGCVGCGRCITWCPAGIDLVHEAKLLAEEPR
ncbi:MAG: 4Fe-4S dicluster domain-containing protein, partial [Planctomycetales bacterium]|nr:4Fe-4S dicluster domain-containing protein [Planctomycetales bacterium]